MESKCPVLREHSKLGTGLYLRVWYLTCVLKFLMQSMRVLSMQTRVVKFECWPDSSDEESIASIPDVTVICRF